MNVGENKPLFTDENSVKQNPHCHSLSSIVSENEMSESGKSCSARSYFEGHRYVGFGKGSRTRAHLMFNHLKYLPKTLLNACWSAEIFQKSDTANFGRGENISSL